MTIARRDFLKVVGGASFAGSLTSVALPAMSAGTSVPDFGFSDDSVPMNAANLCPVPLNVSAAEAKYARELDLDLSPATRSRIEALKEDARTRIAGLLGITSDELAIVRNTSEANNVIVQGMPLEAGDEIVLWDQNHPSNSVAWDVRAARSGCSVRRFSVPTEAGSIDEVVDLFLNSLSDRTKVLSFTHISNITGFRTPAAAICDAVRRKRNDIHIHVDGAQTWGAVAIDLGKLGCDSFSGSAHKWFMGPREVGILFVRDRNIGRIWPIVVSVPWGGDANSAPKGARKFDALGQRDDAAIASLGAAASLHENLTPAGIEKQSAQIAGRLREGLLDMGLPFVSSVNPQFTSSVIILKAAREIAPQLVTEILKDSGVITAAVGGFRMSPHVYNTADHVDRIVAAAGKSRALFHTA
jgi:selenocysteine lyase/cysteine desulfurase